MLDHSESRIWVAHHDQFSEWVRDAVASLRAGFARLAGWDGTTVHLLILIASFAMTGLTFNNTAA